MNAASGFVWTGWATLAALGVYFWTVFAVGRGRGTYKVKAPSMEGPPEFMNMVRVQANTVEQLVLFLPALWLCALFRGDRIAALFGAVWVVGRIAYAIGYYSAPSKRGPGFLIAMIATAGLVVTTVIGLLGQMH